MLFLARMDATLPPDLDPEVKADYLARQKTYCVELQERGVMKAIWRVVGENANYSIFDLDDHDELHRALQGLPLFAFLKVMVTPLAKHPDALDYYLKG